MTFISIDFKKFMFDKDIVGINTFGRTFKELKVHFLLKKYNISKNTSFPNSNYICKYGLYLPSGLNLKTSEINFICSKINKIFKNY